MYVTASENCRMVLDGRRLLTDSKRLRKLLAPAFTPSQIRHFTPLFWDKSKELTSHIRNQILTSGRQELEINMLNWTDRVTLDMIGLSAFGTDFEGLRDPEQGLYSLYDKLYPMDGFSEPLDVLCVYVLPMFLAPAIVQRLPLKPIKDQRQNSQLLRDFCLSLIKKQQNVKDLELEEGNHKRKYFCHMDNMTGADGGFDRPPFGHSERKQTYRGGDG